MRTRRLGFERLEDKMLLSAATFLNFEPVAAATSAEASIVGDSLATVQTSTTLQLVGGQTIVLEVAPEDVVGDLSGIAFQLRQDQGPPTPAIDGIITEGQLTPDGQLFLIGSGELQATLEIANGNSTVRLKGGSLSVKIEQSEFKSATLENVQVEVETSAPNSNGPLKLKGTLNSGTYKPGEGVSFNARLEVTDDFVYEKGPVKTTLKAGGSVQATVESNDLKQASFDNLDGEVELEILDEPLMLKGTLNGKYENDLIDFEGSLELRETWVYTKPNVTARLSGGSVEIQVEGSEFKKAELQLDGEVDIQVPNTNGLKLGGSLQGRYEDGKVDVLGTLSLRSPFELHQGGVQATIPSGEEVHLRIQGSQVVARMQNVPIHGTTQIGSMALGYAGTVHEAVIRNGRLLLHADAHLIEPAVIWSQRDWQFKLAKARLKLIVAGSRVTIPIWHDLRFVLCREDSPFARN